MRDSRIKLELAGDERKRFAVDPFRRSHHVRLRRLAAERGWTEGKALDEVLTAGFHVFYGSSGTAPTGAQTKKAG